jgi:hypothetical protein
MKNLRFLFYTYEKNISFAELCLKYFLKHNKRNDLNITLVTNKFPHNDFKYKNRVTYYSSNVELKHNGHHFGETVLKSIKQIDEEFIFFLLDDYFFINEIKYDDLEDVINLMKCEKIDYFGFDDIGGTMSINDFEKFQTKCKTKISDGLYLRSNEYQYLFSLQPCIWKKTSLISLLEKCDNISLHDLDETKKHIKEIGSSLKGTASELKSCFNHVINFTKEQKPEDYYVISYIEIVRHGCFNIPENGMPINPKDYSVIFTYNLIEDEDLGSKIEFKHLLPDVFRKTNTI